MECHSGQHDGCGHGHSGHHDVIIIFFLNSVTVDALSVAACVSGVRGACGHFAVRVRG